MALGYLLYRCLMVLSVTSCPVFSAIYIAGLVKYKQLTIGHQDKQLITDYHELIIDYLS